MKTNKQLPLNRKLTLAIVITGIVPALVIGFLAVHTASKMSEDIAHTYASEAENIADKIDRNLFERYGDVQAFGVNDSVNDKKSWYQIGSDHNRIANAANSYANLYGFYVLSFMVDLEGKVVAVNDKDPAGKAIDTKWIYQENYKDAEWFKESLAGHFLKSDTLNGTFVQDVHVDENVKKIYGSDGLVLGFSAPVKDTSGKIVGVWHNCANFSLVEEVVADAYDGRFKGGGQASAELTLIDHTGRVLVDYAPTANGGKTEVQHDMKVLLKANLAEQGFGAAAQVITGKLGSGTFADASKKISQVTGFAPCNGQLGFAGLKWGVLVRVPKTDALAAMTTQLYHITGVIALSIAALIGFGLWLGRSISRPLIVGIDSIREVGSQVTSAATQFASSSQCIAEAASEQAASLEETSASLEEIASMTKRNAENAINSKNLSQQASHSATTGLERLGELSQTINAIKTAVGDMEAAVHEMQGSSQEIAKIIKTIDEIAFQTNLLALNAAVEAARAGEAGMGFAVVADEVRALAQRSAQAARDTSDKIEHAIKRSELGGVASAKVVKNLVEVEGNARNIEQVFNGIVAQIKSLDEVIGEISAASREQSQGVGEVNMAVGQMDKVTQSNASNAEENASAAEQLNSQVNTLQQIVGSLEVVVNGHATNGATPAPQKNPATAGRTPTAAKHKSARMPSVGENNRSNSAAIPMPEPGTSSNAAASFKDF